MGGLLFTVGCGAGSPARRGTGSYAQAVDSQTAACNRTPAYCARVAGEETALAGGRAAPVLAAAKAWEELDVATLESIENLLQECARWAMRR